MRRRGCTGETVSTSRRKAFAPMHRRLAKLLPVVLLALGIQTRAATAQQLDCIIYRAGQLDLKIIIPFVNNWHPFGGMDQYVRWKGAQFHDDFYRDPTIRQWYKDWISHLRNHVNLYTGIAYKDDATIMA